MPKRRPSDALPSLGALDREAGHLGVQIARHVRQAIADGELRPGARVPSTRALAASLRVSRGTVAEAFSQLAAEGYLQATVGAGTRVALGLPDENWTAAHDHAPMQDGAGPTLPPDAARLSSIGQALAPQPPVPFAIAVPVGAVAPDIGWRRLGNRVRASRAGAPAGYLDPRGLPDLRAAIASYVRTARAVRCTPDQVIVTAGTQQGLYLTARVLLGRGERVWIEDPAYPGITAVLDDLGVPTARIPVDGQGMNVEQGIKVCPDARVAFVTPSHQYPLGMPMSMGRRTALLAWARGAGAWVVEDDYDSELRYAGHPFPSLQGLDPSRVVYLGTFSKVLFPSLRLGYAIVPEPLADAFAGARALIDRHPPASDQHVLAAFMQGGQFGMHVRRIRGVYGERRAALLGAVGRHLAGLATVQPGDQGMHVVLWLPPGTEDVPASCRAAAVGLAVRPVSPMHAAQPARQGLMLGFGGFTADQLEAAVVRLKGVLTTA